MDNQSTVKTYYFRVKNWAKDNENTLVLGASFVLVSIIAFGLGVLWQGSKAQKAPIIVDKSKSAFANKNHESGITNHGDLASGQEQKINTQASILYIASKSGAKYHLPSCPGAKQIKPENRIEFKSKEEAEARGYSPAANCPGL